MARINLLPWREERRRLRQRQFLTTVAGAVLLMGGVVLYTHTHVAGLISYQQERNGFLSSEIEVLDRKIAEISDLDATKRKLLARMEIIQQLQSSRPQIVHLFDQLARTVPEGVYLSTLTHQGNVLTIEGVAQSNARVSAYMHNIEDSTWLTEPRLQIIESREQEESQERLSRFTLEVKQVSQKAQEAKATS
jgi:type IV pilus assembly protein PilN